jgi:DNA mismatch endonuclease (patch repair protein)
MPVAQQAYWIEKFEKTTIRDIRARAGLEKAGWKVVVVWECQLRQAQWISEIKAALDASEHHDPRANSECR